jgi:hypothetical protein
MAASCIIVNNEGFDLDVALNLDAFYSACGFDVGYATEPRDADLLVFQRAKVFDRRYSARAPRCHVHDYSKTGVLKAVAQVDGLQDIAVISPSDPGADAADNALSYTHVRAYHPVCASLWSNVPRPQLRFQQVHIGHQKKTDAPDPLQALFSQALLDAKDCAVFGNGWKEDPRFAGRAHGPCTLHETQVIYAATALAAGVMYPYQRGKTLSGRMWQGPLNGCQVLTEALPPGMSLPGVHLTRDYSELQHPVATHARRQTITAEAQTYWTEQAVDLARTLGLPFGGESRARARWLYLTRVYSRYLKTRLRWT